MQAAWRATPGQASRAAGQPQLAPLAQYNALGAVVPLKAHAGVAEVVKVHVRQPVLDEAPQAPLEVRQRHMRRRLAPQQPRHSLVAAPRILSCCGEDAACQLNPGSGQGWRSGAALCSGRRSGAVAVGG